MTAHEQFLDFILNKLTHAHTRDSVVTMIYCFPVGSSLFVVFSRIILSYFIRQRLEINLGQCLLMFLVIAAILISITPTAFIFTTTSLMRPGPYCGARFDPELRVDQDLKFYVLTTGKSLKLGTAWVINDGRLFEGDKYDIKTLSDACVTGVKISDKVLEESVIRVGRESKAGVVKKFKRNISTAALDVIEFSRGKFFYLSDCFDLERLIERLFGRISPWTCVSGYVHSDQLSFTTNIDD